MSGDKRAERFVDIKTNIGRSLNVASVYAKSPLLMTLQSLPLDQMLGKAIQGILNYGKKYNCQNEAREIANNLITASKHKNRELIQNQIVRIYTKQSFLYRDINKYLRNSEFTYQGGHQIKATFQQQAKFLLPYCNILNQLVQQKIRKDGFYGTVYRGAQLSQNQIKQYVTALNQDGFYQWNGFTSATKNRKIAQKFGNILFIINISKQNDKEDTKQAKNHITQMKSKYFYGQGCSQK